MAIPRHRESIARRSYDRTGGSREMLAVTPNKGRRIGSFGDLRCSSPAFGFAYGSIQVTLRAGA
jgi:hypothetical protein